jgi:hypothetical protein
VIGYNARLPDFASFVKKVQDVDGSEIKVVPLQFIEVLYETLYVRFREIAVELEEVSNSSGSSSGTPVVSVETYAASMALDWTDKDEIQITLTGNLSVTDMSGGVSGKRYVLTLIQDATGGRTFTDGTGGDILFSDDIPAITLSTAASETDRFGFIYRDTKFDLVASLKGLS